MLETFRRILCFLMSLGPSASSAIKYEPSISNSRVLKGQRKMALKPLAVNCKLLAVSVFEGHILSYFNRVER